MKLAEALQERADVRAKIGALATRLCSNATVQEGEETAESPDDLMRELDAATARSERLIASINLANSRTTVEGRTMTEWLAHKEALSSSIQNYKALISSAQNGVGYRSMRSEIKMIRTVSIKEIQRRVDDLAAEYRRVDNMIQAANWSTEIEV